MSAQHTIADEHGVVQSEHFTRGRQKRRRIRNKETGEIESTVVIEKAQLDWVLVPQKARI